MSVNTAYLTLSWSTSKGRDTHGYNICRLDTPQHRIDYKDANWAFKPARRFSCMGGGYDMVGTVFADWLEDRYQDRLLKIKHRIACHILEGGKRAQTDSGLYGGTYFTAGEHSCGNEYVSLDGACGFRSIETIAAAIGVSATRNSNARGKLIGIMITDYGSEEALKAAGR